MHPEHQEAHHAAPRPAPATDQAADTTLPLYHAGTWTTAPDPLAPYAAASVDKQLEAAGYTRRSTLGDEDGWQLEVWMRAGEGPACYVTLYDAEAGYHFLAATAPDALDLLARWAPIVQAGAVASFLGMLSTDLFRFRPELDGIVESITRRAVWALDR